MWSSAVPTSSLQTSHTSIQKLNLTTGQIFQGKIAKFFPNNLAVLQLGNMSVTARLEAPLSAGMPYWFEVLNGRGVPTLKVLDDNRLRQQENHRAQGNTHSQGAQILHQLGLAPTKGNEQLLQLFAEHKLPFTKETFEKASQIMQQHNGNRNDAFQQITSLLQKNLPLTNESFLAMRAVQSAPGPMVNQLTDLISTMNGSLKESPTLRSFSQGIQAIMNETIVAEGKHPLLNLLSASAQTENKAQVEGAVNVLKRVGLMPQNSTVDSFFENFKSQVLLPQNRQLVSTLWPSFSGQSEGNVSMQQLDGKTLFHLLMSNLKQPLTKEEATMQLQSILTLLRFKGEINGLQQQFNALGQNVHQLGKAEREVFSGALMQGAVSNDGPKADSPIASQLMRIMSSMGYLHEKETMQLVQTSQVASLESAQGERLKSLLLQLHSLEMNSTLKEKVEAVLHRLTGQQLLAQDQTGPLQQTVIQFPLQLGGYPTDLTVQWEGRKTKDGTIDPEHCRILFYLELERLNETVVDVQVQKKIVSIQVYNENTKPHFLMEILQPILKQQLEKLDYQLSTVKWVSFDDMNKNKPASVDAYTEKVGYQGVDIRI